MSPFISKNARYDGRAFLRLLELYVLWAIEEIDTEYANKLEEITPNLQKTYKRGGNWQSIIAAEMEFSPAFPDTLKQLWQKNTEIASKNGVRLSPQQFAEMVVDENFPVDRIS